MLKEVHATKNEREAQISFTEESRRGQGCGGSKC